MNRTQEIIQGKLTVEILDRRKRNRAVTEERRRSARIDQSKRMGDPKTTKSIKRKKT